MAAANNKQQFHVLYHCNKSWADDRMMVGPAIFWRKADLDLYRNFLQHQHQNGSTSGSGSHASVVHTNPNLVERRNTKTGFGFECQSFDSVEQAISFLEEEQKKNMYAVGGKNNTTNDQEKKNKQKTKLTAKTTATKTTNTTTLTKKKSLPPPVANTPAAVGGRLVCNSAARNGRKAASSIPALMTTANTIVPPNLSVIGTTTPSAAAATTVTPPACLVPHAAAAAAAPTTAVVTTKQPVPAPPPPPPPFFSPPLLPQPAPPFLLPFVTVAAVSAPLTTMDAAKTTNGGMYAPIAPNGVLPPATVLPLTEPTTSKRRRRPKRSAEEREADKKRASEARKRQRTDKFTEKYQAHMDLLRKFKSERGHANVPQKILRGSPDDVKGYRRLHFWLKSIKVQIERYEDDPDTSMLSDAQAKELQEMGVERTRSKAEKRFRQDEATFDDLFRELQNFHTQHGHTNVPQQPRTALYSWVMRIRQAYQELKQKKPAKRKSTSDPSPTRNVLTPQRMAQLAQLGFSFTTATRASFDERALEWLEYKTKHQCEPPPKTILGGWCKRTRRRYRDLVHGRKNKRWEPLTQEQADKLTDWGFNWGNVSKSTDPSKKTKKVSMSFAQRLEMLQSYKQEHGNVLISASHPDLGKWCKRLRLEYRKLQNGQKLSKATLNQARIEQLLGLGFDFGFQPNDSRRSINAGRGSEGSRDGSDSDSSSSTSDDEDEDEDEGEDADDDDDDDDDVDEDDDNNLINNGEHRYPPHQLQGSSPGEQQRLVFPHTLRDRQQQQQQQQPWDKYNTDPSPNLHH